MLAYRRSAIWVAVVCVTLGFFWLVRGVLPPFMLAFVVAIILEPLVKRLCDRGLPRFVAVGVIVVAFFAIAAGLLLLLAPRVGDQITEARGKIKVLADQWSEDEALDNVFYRWNPEVRARPAGPLAVVDKSFEQLKPVLTQMGLPSNRREVFEEYIAPHRDEIAGTVEKSLNAFIGSIGGTLVSILPFCFTPIFVMVILLDLENMKSKAKLWIPPSWRQGTVDVTHDIIRVLQRYLQGTLLNISCYAVVMGVVLTAIGVPYSMLLALLAAVFYLIPFLGGWFSVAIIICISLLSNSSGAAYLHIGSPFGFALVIFCVFFLVSASWDMFVTPNVVGRAVNLHPLLAMFVVGCGAALFGLPGMVLAYPLAGIVKVTLARIIKVANDPSVVDLGLPAVPPRHRLAV